MHLKRHIVLLLGFVSICQPCFSARRSEMVEQDAVKQAKTLISRVDKELDASLEELFAMTQILSKIESAPTFKELVSYTTANWESIVDNWGGIAVDENTRLIQLHALLFLPPEDYLNCLKRVLKLYEQGDVDRHEMFMLLFSAENEKRWFLSSNYNDPMVMELFDELSRVFSKDQQITETIKFYKSGKAKKRDEFVRNEKPKGYYAMEPLPLLHSTMENERRANRIQGQIRNNSLITAIILLLSVGMFYLLRKRGQSPNEGA